MFKYIYRWPISRYEGFASNLGYLLRKPYSLQVFVYPVIRTVIIKSVSIDQEKYALAYTVSVCVYLFPPSLALLQYALYVHCSEFLILLGRKCLE